MSVPPWVRAFIGLGGNLGAVENTLHTVIRAFDALPATRLLRASRLYRTPAWGREDQPDFVNAVAEIETALDPRALLDALLGIEREHGRERSADDPRWGPRTLDLDLLLYGDAIVDAPGLCIPHPHLHQRAFVLVPLLELAPDLVIPGRGSARAALTAIVSDGIEALP